MAVGAFIFTMSLQQYFTYKRDTDVQIVKSNVEQIFRAMAMYYQAACYGQTNATTITQPVTGVLPTSRVGVVSGGIQSPTVVNIQNVLSEYLQLKILPAETIVDTQTVKGISLTEGYYAGFARLRDPAEIDTVQVAVHLKPGVNANGALALLQGDCITNKTGGSLNPCSANRRGEYILWERPPSMSKITSSDYWLMQPIIKQFTGMYRPSTECRY